MTSWKAVSQSCCQNGQTFEPRSFPADWQPDAIHSNLPRTPLQGKEPMKSDSRCLTSSAFIQLCLFHFLMYMFSWFSFAYTR